MAGFFFLITEMRSLQNHNGSTIHKNMLMLHLKVLQKLRFSELCFLFPVKLNIATAITCEESRIVGKMLRKAALLNLSYIL